MTTVEIFAGVCGFTTRVQAVSEDQQHVEVRLETDCPGFLRLGGRLGEFDAYTELFSPVLESEVCRQLATYQRHAACPVAAGVLKAVEAEAGLALPKNAMIKFVDSSEG